MTGLRAKVILDELASDMCRDFPHRVLVKNGVAGLEVDSNNNDRSFVVTTTNGEWSDLTVDTGHGYLKLHGIDDAERTDVLRRLIALGLTYVAGAEVGDSRNNGFGGGELVLSHQGRSETLTLSAANIVKRFWLPRRFWDRG